MNTERKKIWQVAAGDGPRHYAGLCLQNDVIVIGPGAEGPWPECEKKLLVKGRVTAQKMGMIRRFVQAVSPGDLIVLRVGTQTVYGVGEVVGPYMWVPDFWNVQTWDLQHTRRVRWLWQNFEHPKKFPPYSLKFGASLQEINSTQVQVLAWLKGLDVPAAAYSRPLALLAGQRI